MVGLEAEAGVKTVLGTEPLSGPRGMWKLHDHREEVQCGPHVLGPVLTAVKEATGQARLGG